MQLVNQETGEVVLSRLQIADTWWRRFIGLQGRTSLPPQEGFVLAPCRSIHTHWMRFAIDVAFLDQDGLVLLIKPAVRPWSVVVGPKSGYRVIETAAGGLKRLGIGDRVSIVDG